MKTSRIAGAAVLMLVVTSFAPPARSQTGGMSAYAIVDPVLQQTAWTLQVPAGWNAGRDDDARLDVQRQHDARSFARRAPTAGPARISCRAPTGPGAVVSGRAKTVCRGQGRQREGLPDLPDRRRQGPVRARRARAQGARDDDPRLHQRRSPLSGAVLGEREAGRGIAQRDGHLPCRADDRDRHRPLMLGTRDALVRPGR